MRVSSQPKSVFGVSELTAKIKALLEEAFPFVWIRGEISNLRRPSSGHFYFTLKDDKAQVSAVMFRGQQAGLRFRPEDGLEITGFGRIALYEPRGAYQIVFEYMEPCGIGALQKAFEQLKTRLSEEGLFDAGKKKPIPFLPRRIAVITSPTGAVVHDVLTIVSRRYENIEVLILPVKVQGEGAVEQIVEALESVNARRDIDTAILARGGGSLEDFQAFNSEEVARAIFASEVPIVSATGHETDFTIADFAADLRAPTPSAAAELAVPVKSELKRSLGILSDALELKTMRIVKENRERLRRRSARLVHPEKRIQDWLLKIDDLGARMARIVHADIDRRRERLGWKIERLRVSGPEKRIAKVHDALEQNKYKLLSFFRIRLEKYKFKIEKSAAALTALNPTAILDRGYSITRLLPERTVVREAAAAPAGRLVEITLAQGALVCRVEEKRNE